MKYQIVSVDDVRWLLGHTGGFRGGYVTDVQVSKRRLLDEGTRARADASPDGADHSLTQGPLLLSFAPHLSRNAIEI